LLFCGSVSKDWDAVFLAIDQKASSEFFNWFILPKFSRFLVYLVGIKIMCYSHQMQQIFCSYLFLNSHVTPQVLYREDLGRATPTPVTPEIERVKRNQENFSSVLFLI